MAVTSLVIFIIAATIFFLFPTATPLVFPKAFDDSSEMRNAESHEQCRYPTDKERKTIPKCPRAGGSFPIKDECSLFIKCFKGDQKPTYICCPDQLQFDHIFRRCVKKRRARCKSVCPRRGIKYPHRNNTARYFMCTEKGFPEMFLCPDNYHFQNLKCSPKSKGESDSSSKVTNVEENEKSRQKQRQAQPQDDVPVPSIKLGRFFTVPILSNKKAFGNEATAGKKPEVTQTRRKAVPMLEGISPVHEDHIVFAVHSSSNEETGDSNKPKRLRRKLLDYDGDSLEEPKEIHENKDEEEEETLKSSRIEVRHPTTLKVSKVTTESENFNDEDDHDDDNAAVVKHPDANVKQTASVISTKVRFASEVEPVDFYPSFDEDEGK